MAGRNTFTGENRKNLLRNQDRSNTTVQPKAVNHISQLPAAHKYPGRMVYVAGITKAFYYSNGVSWAAV